MSNVIEQPRFGCALGSQQTVTAIERAIPIVHSGPGCSAKLFSGMSFSAGYQGTGYAGGSAIVCTNAGEREVVFGGTEQLHKVIEGALKIMDGDLFVVLTGCTSDIVGDDVPQVVSEFRRRGVNIAYAETGGFKSNAYVGHETVTKAIIEQLLDDSDKKEAGLVNVFASVPYLDPFWRGNLDELKSVLEGIGLVPNILFGFDSGGFPAWQKIPSAQFNIVVSPWVGVDIARFLEEKYKTPFLHYPVFPIGAVETSRFLREVARFTGIDSAAVEKYISKEEKKFYYYIESAADFLMEFRYDLPGRYFNILDSFYSLGLSRFLSNELGLLPGHQYITDNPPEQFREEIVGHFKRLNETVASGVSFIVDGNIIEHEIMRYDHKHLPLVLGTSWDNDIAKNLNGFKLSLGVPITDRLIMSDFYAGYRGGLNLIQDVYSVIIGSHK